MNPTPCTLVAVEPDPKNFEWIKRLSATMASIQIGIGCCRWGSATVPTRCCFPVGSPGSGLQNCFSSNEEAAHCDYADEFIKTGRADEALCNVLLQNTPRIVRPLDQGEPFMAEIKFVSPVTLRDLLGPFERVDHLEADLHQSEMLAFPPFIDLLHEKVRRSSGPTAPKVHSALHDLFISRGWEIVFSFAPNTGQETVLGGFNANDCTRTVLNPSLQSIG